MQLSIKVETVDKEKLQEFDQLDYKKLGIFVSESNISSVQVQLSPNNL